MTTIKAGFVRGPKGYPIKINGPTFNKLSKVQQQKLILESGQGTLGSKIVESGEKLPPGYVYSPVTGKAIKIGGITFKKLTPAEQKKALKGTGLERTDVIARKKGPFRKTKVRRLISPKPVELGNAPIYTGKMIKYKSARRLSPRRIPK